MQLSATDRLLAGLACAYFCYRVISALRTGVYQGDGDLDVHAERNPAAFALTVASGLVVALLLAILFGMPNGAAAPASTKSHDQDVSRR